MLSCVQTHTNQVMCTENCSDAFKVSYARCCVLYLIVVHSRLVRLGVVYCTVLCCVQTLCYVVYYIVLH